MPVSIAFDGATQARSALPLSSEGQEAGAPWGSKSCPRRHLVATQLYELRLDICRLGIFGAAVAAGPLDALDGRESRVAGELQELYHHYVKELDTHQVAHLDQSLDRLLESSKALRAALLEDMKTRKGTWGLFQKRRCDLNR